MEISVAIVDSSLADDDTLKEKSRKAAFIARALAMFRVSRVFIYRDRERDYSSDRRLLKLILEFMDTPQYLRKLLYRRIPELSAAGLFPPLKAPHHKPFIKPEEININEIRQGVIIKRKDTYFIEAGINRLIPLEDSDLKEGSRVTVKFTSKFPNLRCSVIKKDEIKEYWGYEVHLISSLSSLLARFDGLKIITSRRGNILSNHESILIDAMKESKRMLIVFGSTRKGVQELLEKEHKNANTFTKHIYNFFPAQGVATVRIEEAILGCLSILNYIEHRINK